MKPGQTIFWKDNKNGKLYEGVLGIAMSFGKPQESDRHVEMVNLMERDAAGAVEVFDVEGKKIVKNYELDYMKQNSRDYGK